MKRNNLTLLVDFLFCPHTEPRTRDGSSIKQIDDVHCYCSFNSFGRLIREGFSPTASKCQPKGRRQKSGQGIGFHLRNCDKDRPSNQRSLAESRRPTRFVASGWPRKNRRSLLLRSASH